MTRHESMKQPSVTAVSRLVQWGMEAAAIEMGWFEKQMTHRGVKANTGQDHSTHR